MGEFKEKVKNRIEKSEKKIKKAVKKWKEEMTPEQKEKLEKVKEAYTEVKDWYKEKVVNSKWAKRARDDLENAREKVKKRNETFKGKVDNWLVENGFQEFAGAQMTAALA